MGCNNVKLSDGGNVYSFLWSPDLTVTNLIAYLADQQTTNVNELYTSTPEVRTTGMSPVADPAVE